VGLKRNTVNTGLPQRLPWAKSHQGQLTIAADPLNTGGPRTLLFLEPGFFRNPAFSGTLQGCNESNVA